MTTVWAKRDGDGSPDQRLARRRHNGAAPDGAGCHHLRVMSYNVHSCVGVDRRLAPERIAAVIARFKPDIVALQELDVGRPRSNHVDQAALIAHHLDMSHAFHPAIHVAEERYGDAVLTHLPMREIKTGLLPGCFDRAEPRGALWVAIECGDIEVQVLNTHFGLTARERQIQAECLLGPEWLGHADCRPPVILCGDFNARPKSLVGRLLASHLVHAQSGAPNHRQRQTFHSMCGVAQIDHVYLSPAFSIQKVQVPRDLSVRVASDHLPLIVDVSLTDHDVDRHQPDLRREALEEKGDVA